MSTIKVTNIQDTSGGNNSTSEEIKKGRARVWVDFNGTGTVAVRNDYNVNTISDDGTGLYTINFSITMSNANFVFQCNGIEILSSSSRTDWFFSGQRVARNTGYMKVSSCNAGGTVLDPETFSFVAWDT